MGIAVFIVNEFAEYFLPCLMFAFGGLGILNLVYGTAILVEDFRYHSDESYGAAVLFYGIVFEFAFLACVLIYKGAL